MDTETLQSKIDCLSHDEMAKILLDVADEPEVRNHIVAAVENSETRSTFPLRRPETPPMSNQPRAIWRERSNSTSTASTAPPPYSPPRSSTSHPRHHLLHYYLHCRLSTSSHVPSQSDYPSTPTPCVCKNCKKLFWGHEQSMPVADCVGHPGTLEKLHKVIPSHRKRRLVEAKYLDAYSGHYKCWTCCLQKKSAPGCSALDYHIAA